MDIDQTLDRAAAAIADAEAILIGAGAGMGVDSGLPDFRGSQGFWRAYPPYARLGLGFAALADPRWFGDDPPLAWGFYGHRLGLYRRTRLISGPQGPRVLLDGTPVLLLCSNNYLGLADHPRVREAAADAAMRWGVGAGA